MYLDYNISRSNLYFVIAFYITVMKDIWESYKRQSGEMLLTPLVSHVNLHSPAPNIQGRVLKRAL